VGESRSREGDPREAREGEKEEVRREEEKGAVEAEAGGI